MLSSITNHDRLHSRRSSAKFNNEDENTSNQVPFSYINTLEEKNNFETSPVPPASNKVVSKKSSLTEDQEENRPLMKNSATPISIKHDLSVVEEVETDPNMVVVA